MMRIRKDIVISDETLERLESLRQMGAFWARLGWSNFGMAVAHLTASAVIPSEMNARQFWVGVLLLLLSCFFGYVWYDVNDKKDALSSDVVQQVQGKQSDP